MSLSLPWLDDESLDFPDPATALTTPNGLLAVGGDLRPARLLKAYELGIFPWYNEEQPPLWWSPDPRMVLFPQEMHISRSLAKLMKSGYFTVTSDRTFARVLEGCAEPRPGSDGTWLSDEMQAAYLQLHELGHAHSVEVWRDDLLVGGVYGIALEGIFYGESMFSRVSNASKVAMATLAGKLAVANFRIIDCQVASPHLSSLGARLISRADFFRYLPSATDISRPARWPIQ
ncbi:MAG: leucyl/phenylalanyl-tRNA--protein transferase [Pseudomonadota bacterium]